ncbi:hypothetical protein [Cellulosimicrobium sp. NPDC057862]|uniref:hypothetical protein n=1 Tax=Cellulosimicrobium sp. NPDC057862 TaxID=3346266 RepID=UPI00366B81EC
MDIEIRLLARLLRIPLLRVEGVVAIRDDDDLGELGGSRATPGTSVVDAPSRRALARRPDPESGAPLGRDLAAAEALLAALNAPGRHGDVRSLG